MANSYFDVAGNIANGRDIAEDTTERQLARAQVYATLALTEAVHGLRSEVSRVADAAERSAGDGDNIQASINGLQNTIREVAQQLGR